jgi:hypothetical protein
LLWRQAQFNAFIIRSIIQITQSNHFRVWIDPLQRVLFFGLMPCGPHETDLIFSRRLSVTASDWRLYWFHHREIPLLKVDRV